MNSRNFLLVRIEVEKVIRRWCDEDARHAAVALVDTWAAEVIIAHVGTHRFPLGPLAEFTAAASASYFGMLGGGRNQPPEVTGWVVDCNRLMCDRLRFWAKQSGRFRRMPSPNRRQSVQWSSRS
jgi:hypothetical protein